MISAFGVEHTVSKAMTPNKMAAFRKIKAKADLTTVSGVNRDVYASNKLTAHSKGKMARQAPRAANVGGWMSANNQLAHQGQLASRGAKIFESTGSRTKATRKLP